MKKTIILEDPKYCTGCPDLKDAGCLLGYFSSMSHLSKIKRPQECIKEKGN